METVKLSSGQLLRAHNAGDCSGPHCAIHNPSQHSMVGFTLYWRDDRGLFERICSHGIGHPDPDDLTWKHDHMPDYNRYAFGVHGCDGCCSEAYDKGEV